MPPYRIILIVVALVVINALGLSLTLVATGSYKNSLYYRFTRQRFAWIVSDPPPKYALLAGWASEALALEGTSAADSHQQDTIQTRALVLDNGSTRAAIITVDLQSMPPTVAQALKQPLARIGFAWKNVYLGATYSQPGPGGWTDDYISKRQFGPYDPQRVGHLTEAILKAVRNAQAQLATIQIGYSQTDQTGQEKRSFDRSQTGLHLVQLRKQTGESAVLLTGTASSAQGSVPGQLSQVLDKQPLLFTLTLAGSVQAPGSSNSGSTRDAELVASRIATLLARQPLHTDSTLIAQTAPLIQNDPHIRISQNWRLKPWLAKALYGDYPAELKAIRLGQTVFVGCPGEVSTELTQELLALPIAKQWPLIITSNNGGYLGKLAPDRYYFAPNSPYALGDFNRFGPYTAEFLQDMTQSLVSSLK